MEQQYIRTIPVFWKGKNCGTVQIAEKGLYLCMEAYTELPMEGIYRAYLQFENGEYLLGVMEPWGRGMGCRRTFAYQQLRPFGVLSSCILRGTEKEAWTAYDGKLPGVFSHKITGQGLLQEETADGYRIAIPYAADRPFPLTELFCFATVCRIGERDYAVYRFDKEGAPKI